MITRVIVHIFVAVLDGLAPEYSDYMRSRPAPADAVSFMCIVVRATVTFPVCGMDFNRYCDILGHVRFLSTTAIRKDSICPAPNIVMLVADHLAYRHLCHHTIT